MRIVVATSDAYLHLMRPFAYCFNKFWGGHVDVLCYKEPKGLPQNFHLWSLGDQSAWTFSGGLAHFIKAMGAEAFILLLDDYFLIEPVNQRVVKILWEHMMARPDIGKIDLTPDRLQFPHVNYGQIEDVELVRALWKQNGTSLYHPDGNFKGRLFLMSYQASIWRADFMLKYLDASEGPWESERNGTRRIVEDDPDRLILGTRNHPVKYANMTKSGKPTIWRLDKGMKPELWMELQREGLV